MPVGMGSEGEKIKMTGGYLIGAFKRSLSITYLAVIMQVSEIMVVFPIFSGGVACISIKGRTPPENFWCCQYTAQTVKPAAATDISAHYGYSMKDGSDSIIKTLLFMRENNHWFSVICQACLPCFYCNPQITWENIIKEATLVFMGGLTFES